MTTSFGELAFALWMSLAPGQPAALPAAMTPEGSPTVTLELGTKNVEAFDAAPDWATATRPWSTQGGVAQSCSISVMKAPRDWTSPQGSVPARSAQAFVLAHEIGHCFDTRPLASGAAETARRESFADAFGACVGLKMGLPREDLELVKAAREGSGDGRRSKAQGKSIARALAQPECAQARGARQDVADAWAVAARVDAMVFGEKGASQGPEMARAVAEKARAIAGQNVGGSAERPAAQPIAMAQP